MKQFTRRIITSVALLFFTVLSLQAQEFKWVKGGGTAEDVEGDGATDGEGTYYMCTDPHGNVYALNVVGRDPLYADSFYSSGVVSPSNVFITSYNCAGQMRWAKLIASDGNQCTPDGIIADSLGHVYVTGHFGNLGMGSWPARAGVC